MKTAELPFKIRIASPCPARWEDMGGNDRVRFCDSCKKNVYNLSAMTAPEAVALVDTKQGKLCARVYQRADGTVLTEDCPVGIARHWRQVKARVAGAVAAVLFIVISGTALGRIRGADGNNNDILRDHILTKFDNAVWTVKGWCGMQPPLPIMMGTPSSVMMGEYMGRTTIMPPPAPPMTPPQPGVPMPEQK